jgi:4a-hydroxytetrahydrobiopterin dehydratase
MNTLRHLHCAAYQSDEPPIAKNEIEQYKPQIPDWVLVEQTGIQCLERAFTFKNFAQALRFTDQVGKLAEAESHHPTILLEWGRVTITWWTHKVKGLHLNDFIMAAKTDAVYINETR